MMIISTNPIYKHYSINGTIAVRRPNRCVYAVSTYMYVCFQLIYVYYNESRNRLRKKPTLKIYFEKNDAEKINVDKKIDIEKKSTAKNVKKVKKAKKP